MTTKLSREQFEAEVRAIGAEQYHNNHPFHHRMYQGQCSIDEIRAWALNRFCYQRIIPVKDALIMARIDDIEDRREWRQRIVDHDGEIDDHPEGGLRRWLALTSQLDFSKEYVMSMQGALPATQFASNAYLTFVQKQTVLEAVASSLTELFSPNIIADRVQGMLKNYDFITEESLTYFSYRKAQANRDSNWALDYIDQHAQTRDDQERCLKALKFKCSMLWAMLDAVASAYHLGGTIPPGAWDPSTQVGLLSRSA
jgi:coenzyme PQQ biosynthesis protein C